MHKQSTGTNPRKAVIQRLQKELGKAEEIDIKSAVICGEMGCGESMQDFLLKHPELRCPFMGKVEDPRASCENLQKDYRSAIGR